LSTILQRVSDGTKEETRQGFTKYPGEAYEVVSQALTCKALGFLNERDKNQIVGGYREVIDEIDKLIKTVETR